VSLTEGASRFSFFKVVFGVESTSTVRAWVLVHPGHFFSSKPCPKCVPLMCLYLHRLSISWAYTLTTNHSLTHNGASSSCAQQSCDRNSLLESLACFPLSIKPTASVLSIGSPAQSVLALELTLWPTFGATSGSAQQIRGVSLRLQ
jgi:hypothetical protein